MGSFQFRALIYILVELFILFLFFYVPTYYNKTLLNAFSLNVIFKAIAHLFFKDYQKITIAKMALALM